MEIRRKTFIEIETRRRISIVNPAAGIVAYCPFCDSTAEPLITAEHAAALFGISRRAIYRLIEADTAHSTETANGEVLLCPASLAALTGKTEPNKKPEDR